MKLEIRKNDILEEILCPEGVVLIGFKLKNQVCTNNDIETINAVFHTQCQIVKRPWEDGELTLYFYSSNDPEVRAAIQKYKGITMLSLVCGDGEITATL